jgi:hypothetical protein
MRWRAYRTPGGDNRSVIDTSTICHYKYNRIIHLSRLESEDLRTPDTFTASNTQPYCGNEKTYPIAHQNQFGICNSILPSQGRPKLYVCCNSWYQCSRPDGCQTYEYNSMPRYHTRSVSRQGLQRCYPGPIHHRQDRVRLSTSCRCRHMQYYYSCTSCMTHCRSSWYATNSHMNSSIFGC